MRFRPPIQEVLHEKRLVLTVPNGTNTTGELISKAWMCEHPGLFRSRSPAIANVRK